jgi:integrase
MAAPVKDGSVWRHRFMLDRTRYSGTFPTKAAALAWEAGKRSAVTAAPGTDKTCADAFERYAREVSVLKKGAVWERRRLNAMIASPLGKRPIASVSASDVAAWRDGRLRTVKGATVIREFNLLSHVFAVARKEWHWLSESPTRDVSRPKDSAPRDRLISEDEIERMCLALGFHEAVCTTVGERVAVAFLFAIETAMRSGEICALRPGWVSGVVAHVPALVAKTGVKRDVPLSNRARELLTYLPPADPLFNLSAASRDAIFRKARNMAGIVDLHFHDTRHEAITRLSKKLDVLALARVVGHKDIRELQTYFNARAADLAKLLD